MSELPSCPVCYSSYTYALESLLICPECGHEWSPAEETTADQGFVVKDSNGNILQDGDTMVTIKNLPVKGSSQTIKAGTKVKNIRLVDSDHNIDWRIEGFGAMALKSEFVKKAWSSPSFNYGSYSSKVPAGCIIPDKPGSVKRAIPFLYPYKLP